MYDLYDKIKGDVGFRKEVAEKAFSFELPSKILVIGRNGRNLNLRAIWKGLELHESSGVSGRDELDFDYRPPGPLFAFLVTVTHWL